MEMSRGFPFSFDSVYIGGGTPSVLDAGDVESILDRAFACFRIDSDSETTIEVNPGTVSVKKLSSLAGAGVNRINIGVQSFDDENLRFLGRIHSSADARDSVEWARKAGFGNLGLDLIYGLPGRTVESWISDLSEAVEFSPEHLSCYTLTVEPGTRLDKDRESGKFIPIEESLAAALFNATWEFLDKNGFSGYEISNFSKSKATMSRHNLKYWSSVPYLGIGPSAHSFVDPERWWNFSSIEKYMEYIESGRLPVREKETLAREQRIMEELYVGLRKTGGFRIDEFEKKFGLCFTDTYGNLTAQLKKDGYLAASLKHCSLTRKGMLILNSIVSMMVNTS